MTYRSNMKRLETIQELIIPYVNHEIYFNDPVIVQNNDESIFECWAVASHEGIWLMDEQGQWYKWQATDINADLVMNAINTRLKILQKLKAA